MLIVKWSREIYTTIRVLIPCFEWGVDWFFAFQITTTLNGFPCQAKNILHYYDTIYAVQGCVLLINNKTIINFSLASLNVLHVASFFLNHNNSIILLSSRYGTSPAAVRCYKYHTQALKILLFISYEENASLICFEVYRYINQ